MPAKNTPFQDQDAAHRDPTNRGVVDSVTDKVSGVASQVKDKVSDFGRTAAAKIDESRDGAASGLESAASTLHEKADSVHGIAHATADKLTATAEYVRGHDVSHMMADVEELVRRNAGPSLVAAAAIGFLVGKAFSSKD
jgi:ElaB/YqjD/DUF883 family membrane-anchored ribosome-binding protein